MTTQQTKLVEAKTLFGMIKRGSRVTILVPNGIGRNGQEWKEATGTAVMPSEPLYATIGEDGKPRITGIPSSWTLNMGGRHGTPGVCNPDNIVAIGQKRAYREPKT